MIVLRCLDAMSTPCARSGFTSCALCTKGLICCSRSTITAGTTAFRRQSLRLSALTSKTLMVPTLFPSPPQWRAFLLDEMKMTRNNEIKCLLSDDELKHVQRRADRE